MMVPHNRIYMGLHRDLAPLVATVAFLLATAMHIRSVLTPSMTPGGIPQSGSVIFDSLTVVIPAVAMGTAFFLGWMSSETTPNNIREWIRLTVLGVGSGWLVGFIGVGFVLSTLDYSIATIATADGILQSAILLFFTEALPLIFAALSGISLGRLDVRKSSNLPERATNTSFRAIAFPISIVAVLLAVLVWIRMEMASAATGLFVPLHILVGYALLYVLIPITAMAGAFLVGWHAANQSRVGDDYRRWFVAASTGSIVGWLIGFITFGVLSTPEARMQIQPLLYVAGLSISFQVLPIIFAVVAGLAMSRIKNDGLSQTSVK